MKMTPEKFAEMERLGFIEDKPEGKVLTLSGYRQIQNQEKPIPKKTVVRRVSRTSKTAAATTSCPPDIPSFTPIRETAHASKLKTKSRTNTNKQQPPSQQGQLLQQQEPQLLDQQSTLLIQNDEIEIAQQQQLTEYEQQLSQQIANEQQVLAIPGDGFGGPPNSYFLCIAENGTFVPINNQPLYMDSTNKLVPGLGEMSTEINMDEIIQQQLQEEHIQDQIQQVSRFLNLVVITNEKSFTYFNSSDNKKKVYSAHVRLVTIHTIVLVQIAMLKTNFFFSINL